MNWDLPYQINIDGCTYPIRNKCDYRVVLDVQKALQDERMSKVEKIYCALHIFYGEYWKKIKDLQKATDEMIKILNYGKTPKTNSMSNNQPIMDWEFDFNKIAPAVSRVLGYDVRTPNKFTHWYTFLGAYMEIGQDSTFSYFIHLRKQKQKGKLTKEEREFWNEHKEELEIPMILTEEEKEFLNSEW